MASNIKPGAVIFTGNHKRLAKFYEAICGFAVRFTDDNITVLGSDTLELVIHSLPSEPDVSEPPVAREDGTSSHSSRWQAYLRRGNERPLWVASYAHGTKSGRHAVSERVRRPIPMAMSFSSGKMHPNNSLDASGVRHASACR
jgi:hypothetical protein